jgi:hypothetical protein
MLAVADDREVVVDNDMFWEARTMTGEVRVHMRDRKISKSCRGGVVIRRIITR